MKYAILRNANTCIVVSFYCTLGCWCCCFCHRGRTKIIRPDHSFDLSIYNVYCVYLCVCAMGTFCLDSFENYRKYFISLFEKCVEKVEHAESTHRFFFYSKWGVLLSADDVLFYVDSDEQRRIIN